MAKKNLATATAVTTMQQGNSVIIEVGGSIRRITLEKLIDAINVGDAELLHSVAWGVALKQNQSSTNWGALLGNSAMFEEYLSKGGRYLVKNNGQAAKLSPTNSGIYADGTTLDETKGHVMVIFPDLYYRVVHDSVTGLDYLWMSMIPIGGKVIKRPCIGAYKGSMSSTALVSRSGVAPAGNKTISAFWTAAQVNGRNWGLTNYDHRKFMMMLHLSKTGLDATANPNVQSQLGNGVTGSANGAWDAVSTAMHTGETKLLGDAYDSTILEWTNAAGNAVEDASHVSLFGIEDPYGWQWEMIQGIYCGNSGNAGQTGAEVFIYEGNRMPTAAELSSHPSGDYRQFNRLTSEGYVKKEILGDDFDLFPTEVGGGSTSYWCDYSYANATGQLVLWGGVAGGGAYCGLACVYSNVAFSHSGAGIGARLAYYGDITIVNGADIA